MLFNRNVRWSKEFDKICNKLIQRDYVFTEHLLNQLINGDEKHNIQINLLHFIIREVLRKQEIKPFEVEVIASKITKFCVRTSYNDKKDVCIVFAVGEQLTVKTAWLNNKEDKHETLDKTKFKKRS